MTDRGFQYGFTFQLTGGSGSSPTQPPRPPSTQPPIPHQPQSSTYHPPPSTCYPPPSTYYPPPSTYHPPPSTYHPPPSNGNFHPHNVNSSGPPTTLGSAQSYYDGGNNPPPYQSESGSGQGGKWSGGLAMPAPYPVQSAPMYTPPPNHNTGESPLKVLEGYDIVIIFDDSQSMKIADGTSGRTRWDQAWDALTVLVREGSKYDKDGIQIYFLNKRKASRTVKTESDIRRLRSSIRNPQAATHSPIGDVLDTLLLEYQKRLGNSPGRLGMKKRLFLVISDGVASDGVEDPIIRAATTFEQRHFPLNQAGIQFVQVGNDPNATMFLQQLDEEVAKAGNTRDMVDTLKSDGRDLQGDVLVKALVGGINRREDRAGERRW